MSNLKKSEKTSSGQSGPYLWFGVLTIVLGCFVFFTESVPLRPLGMGWLPINRQMATVIGSGIIFCGLWFLYFAVKNFLKSRRL